MQQKRLHEYPLSLGIPLVVLLVSFAVLGIYPFGGVSVTCWDMDIQYIGYFGWLCDVLHGQGNLAYSFSQGLGEGTLALFSYHLSSPFNLLLLFWDDTSIPQFLSVLTLVKLPFCGLTAYVFLRRRYGSGIVTLLLACSYALSGFAICQCSNIMWIDGMIMLPLVALGTWSCLREGRCGLLFASVACSVLFNWYTGYMDILFALVYSAYCLYEDPACEGRRRAFLRFAATVLLGFGASLVLFLPAALGLSKGTEGSFSLRDFAPVPLIAPWKFFEFLCVGSSPSGSEAKTPCIYVSAVVLVLAFSLFLNPEVPRRRKVAMAVFLATSVLGVLLYGPGTVWSCLKKATSFFFRHAFVVDFMFVIAAAEGARALGMLEGRAARRNLAVAALVSSALIAGSWAACVALGDSDIVSPRSLAIEVGCLLGFAGLLAASASSSPEGRSLPRRLAPILLSALLLAEQGYYATSVFKNYGNDVDGWSEYVGQVRSAYASVGVTPGSGELAGLTGFSYKSHQVRLTSTDSFVLGVQGMNEYTSTVNGSMQAFMQAIGYSTSNVVFGYFYNSPLYVPDRLLGMGYVISSGQPYGTTEVSSSDLPYSGFRIFRYRQILSPGFGVSADAGNVEWTTDPFANQEAMLSDMTGQQATAIYTEDPEEANGVSHPGDGSEVRTFTVTASTTGPAYLSSEALADIAQYRPDAVSTDVSLNGSYLQTLNGRFSNNVIYLGDFQKGETFEVTYTLWYNESVRSAYDTDSRSFAERVADVPQSRLLKVASLDADELERLVSSLDTDGFSMNTFADGFVSCDFTARDDERLLLRIPYDSGWKATVDGRPVECVPCYTGLTGVDVTQGSHHVELRYEPPGLVAGLACTAASVAVFVVWRAAVRKRREGSEPRQAA
jgi:uncharacterized membrane protein YfhO